MVCALLLYHVTKTFSKILLDMDEPQTQRNNFWYSESKIAKYYSSQWHCIPWFGNILDGRLDILLRWPRHRCRPVCVAGDPWHPSGCWSRWRGTGRPASLWPDSRKGSSTQPGHCETAPRWDAPDLYQSWKNNIRGVVYIEGRGDIRGPTPSNFWIFENKGGFKKNNQGSRQLFLTVSLDLST